MSSSSLTILKMAALVCLPGLALGQGRALGPDPMQVFEGHMNYSATAASLLNCVEGTCAGSGNNCAGLSDSTATLDNLPDLPGLRVVHARLNWFASLPQGDAPDTQVMMTPPGGGASLVDADPALSETFDDALDAPSCQLFEFICGIAPDCGFTFMSMHADVTEALTTHRDGGGRLNGLWRVSDVTIPGASDADPRTLVAAAASIAIGGWSLLVVYEEESLPLRRLYYYQGFELISGGERRLHPRGFLAPANPAVDLTICALEGDSGTQGDSVSVNGVEVSDPCNPARNIFNETVNSGRADGRCEQGVRAVDLDTFRLPDALEPGDVEADVLITLPRGDGLLTAGEQVFTNWLLIAFDHIPPSFESIKPEKSANPPSRSAVQPGDSIDYLIVVENTGGDFATHVVLTDAAPPGTTYVEGTTVVDQLNVADTPNGDTPLANGLELTALPGIERIAPAERHIVRFRVTVNDDTLEGTIITNVATISADGTEPARTDPVVHAVGQVPDGGFPELPDQSVADQGPVPTDGPPLLTVDAHVDGGGPRDVGGLALCPLGQSRGDDGLCFDPEAPDQGVVCTVSPDPVCGPGTQMRDGVCVSLCGAGTVWDVACNGRCGGCRAESAPPCDAGGTDDAGCGCRTVGGRSPLTPLLPLALLALWRRRRRG